MANSYPNSYARALAITSAFEGAGFGTVDDARDGQGWSLGAIQWNFGRSTAQPLIFAFQQAGPETFKRCCTVEANGVLTDLSGELLAACRLPADQGVAWCKAHEDANGQPLPHWKQVFANIGAEPGFDAVEAAHTGVYMASAKAYMARFGFTTERALCLLFDTCVQEGSITPPSIERYDAAIFPGETERSKLLSLARAVGPQAGEYEADVESRRLCIVNGTGEVHGQAFDLVQEFGLGDGPVVA